MSDVSERVQRDSVSTVAFKFQAPHLSSLMFKSLGSEQLDKFSEVLIEFYLYLLRLYKRSEDRGSQDHRSRGEKEQGAQALSLGFTAL